MKENIGVALMYMSDAVMLGLIGYCIYCLIQGIKEEMKKRAEEEKETKRRGEHDPQGD